MLAGILIFGFIGVIILAGAIETWRSVFYQKLEIKIHRRNLRIQNRANGNGGMMDWDGGFYD